MDALQSPVSVMRFERESAGELLHLETKRLDHTKGGGTASPARAHRTRGVGWETVHLAIDYFPRVALAAIKPDESEAACVQLLRADV